MCERPQGKCAWEKRRSLPGDRGNQRQSRLSEFGIRLREKQKTRAIYGVQEGQFRRYYAKASRKQGITGDLLLQILENRLDNVVFRMGFFRTRPQARQAVNHGHIQINGHSVDIPSYSVKSGDTISWKESSKKKAIYEAAKENLSETRPPDWVEVNKREMTGRVAGIPTAVERELGLDTRLIIEYYSRR